MSAADPFVRAFGVDRRVSAGGWEVRYREAGEGPVIVLVHGLGVSADYWRRSAPPLAAAGYRVLAPDFPGFGRTKGPREGLSVQRQAASLLAFLDALQVSGAILVGHSLSCQTILQMVVDHPEKARGLVMVAPTGDPRRRRLLRQAGGLVLDVPRESLAVAAEVTRAYLLAGPWRVWRTWKMGGQHDPLALLPRVRSPGLVLVGTRDPVVPAGFAAALAQGLPRGKLRFIEHAAHALIFTHADDFNREVLQFVGETATLPA